MWLYSTWWSFFVTPRNPSWSHKHLDVGGNERSRWKTRMPLRRHWLGMFVFWTNDGRKSAVKILNYLFMKLPKFWEWCGPSYHKKTNRFVACRLHCFFLRQIWCIAAVIYNRVFPQYNTVFLHNNTPCFSTILHRVSPQYYIVFLHNITSCFATILHRVFPQYCTVFLHDITSRFSTILHRISPQYCTMFLHNITHYFSTWRKLSTVWLGLWNIIEFLSC